LVPPLLIPLDGFPLEFFIGRSPSSPFFILPPHFLATAAPSSPGPCNLSHFCLSSDVQYSGYLPLGKVFVVSGSNLLIGGVVGFGCCVCGFGLGLGLFSAYIPVEPFLIALNFATAPSLAVGTSPPCSFFLQPQVTEPPFL